MSSRSSPQDRLDWKAQCKSFELKLEAFCEANFTANDAFQMKTLSELETVVSEGLDTLLKKQNILYCEQKSKELRLVGVFCKNSENLVSGTWEAGGS